MGFGNRKETTDTESEKPKTPWHAMDLEDVYKELGKDSSLLKDGLTSEDVIERLAKYGENKLSEKRKVTLLERIWKQVANVLVAVLVFVAAVSAVRAATATDYNTQLTNWIQVGLIVLVITINTIIGIYQEGSAEEAAAALKSMLSSDAVVVRDGKETKVPAQQLVPGDVVKLNLGDKVPADLRLAVVTQLATAEAALTGESVPIDKITSVIKLPGDADPMQTPLGDRKNMCFSATLVSQGTATGIVVCTGDYTEIGTINKLVNDVVEKKTNVLEQIDRVSTVLAIAICICSLITFLVAWLMTKQVWVDALSTALVCAVAMIPEGLEAIVTMTYSWSVSIMAKNNAIIRALPAVETLGSVTIICSDKTGTLTQNIMSAVAFVTAGKRYRNNVNAAERTPTNFVQDESYMAKRALYNIGGSAVAGSAIVEEHADENENTNSTGGESPSLEVLRQAIVGGVLCSKCVLGTGGSREGEIGNPTELSILRASYFADIDVAQMKEESPIIAEVPFSSEYKFMATVHDPCLENDGADNMGNLVVHVKGAPDRMVQMCKYQAREGRVGDAFMEPIEKDYWMDQIAILSSHGLRVLALCRGSLPKGSISDGQQLNSDFVQDKGEWLTLMGLCAIMDPPRPECVAAVRSAHEAGVRIAMITGDHKDTALAIGLELGIVDKAHSEAITGSELDAMDDDELQIVVQKYNVFARASPQNKIRIVKALQARKEICGMTGDGVNDAPALKAADMGVSMGKEGTDVAREASDMILTDDNFATIIVAVREGRVVWDNLRKILLVNTPINNAQGLSVLFGMLFGLPKTPLSSIQVLYSNLICATTLGFVCAIEPAEEGIMKLPPRRLGKRLIGRYLFLRIIIGTIILTAAVIGAVFWLKTLRKNDGGKYTLEEERGQALNTLNIGAIAITLSARFAYNASYTPRVLTGNPFCWWSVLIMVSLQVFITYTPVVNTEIFSQTGMDGIQWAITVGFTIIVFIVMEFEKGVRRYLASKGEDTEDREYGMFDDVPAADETPKQAS